MKINNKTNTRISVRLLEYGCDTCHLRRSLFVYDLKIEISVLFVRATNYNFVTSEVSTDLKYIEFVFVFHHVIALIMRTSLDYANELSRITSDLCGHMITVPMEINHMQLCTVLKARTGNHG